MKEKINKKKLFYYITFVVSGYIIDIILNYYNFNLLYSFQMLFLGICIYHMRFNDRDSQKGAWRLFEKLLYFIVFPVLYSFLIKFCF